MKIDFYVLHQNSNDERYLQKATKLVNFELLSLYHKRRIINDPRQRGGQ